MRLGNIRVFHVAHYQGDVCIATQPETAIHLNAKYYLQSVLRETLLLSMVQSCDGWQSDTKYHYDCQNSHTHVIPYIKDWDQVETEWLFGPYRLDVALLQCGEVVGAIEVVVFHTCEEEKAAYLNQKGIPWLEVRATPEFYSQPSAWQASEPLVPDRYNDKLVQLWQCNDCLNESLTWQKEKVRVERERLDRERKRAYAKQFDLVAVRKVDYYFPSGKRYRSIYAIDKMIKDGKEIVLQLQEIGSQRRYLASLNPPLTNESVSELKNILKAELLVKKKRAGWLVDDSRDWMKPLPQFHPNKYLDTDAYPYSFEWDGCKWIKVFNQEQSKVYRFPEEKFHSESQPSIPAETYQQFTFFDKEYTCKKCGVKTNDWVVRYNAESCLCRNCSKADQTK